ncbi:hypothetical protein [Psychrobacillus vulpis]|uniref:Uncharacterized protein n=1 Tax=Psychrobacillus vulpis TaxID=2325572 RepID=A0A544TNM1_9BACI|nr:hypothetical protein [Psychrobacillus vulpis]TQR19056.1 hypothetical protein FG384_14635 [Psychrobacillus vulpis]
MKNNTKWALFVSLFVLIGFPIIFLFISLFTEQWKYLIYSVPCSFTAGFTGLIVTIQQIKKERRMLN